MVGFVALRGLNDVCEMLWAEGDSIHLVNGGLSIPVADRSLWLDLQRVEELSGIGLDDHGMIRLGATARLDDLAQNDLVRRRARLLALACSQLGGKQWRRRVSLAGVVLRAAIDEGLGPALTCLDAQAVIRSRDRERRLPVDQILRHSSEACLEAGELLESLRLPIRQGRQLSLHAHAPGCTLALVAKRHRDGSLSRVRVALAGGELSGLAVLARQVEVFLGREPIDELKIERFGELLRSSWSERAPDVVRRVVGFIQAGLLENAAHMKQLRLRQRGRARRRLR